MRTRDTGSRPMARFDATARPAPPGHAPTPDSGVAPRARQWRATAPSPPAASCPPPSGPRCPCRAGARCRRAAATRRRRGAPAGRSARCPTSCRAPDARPGPPGLFRTSRCASSNTMSSAIGSRREGAAFFGGHQFELHLLAGAQLARDHAGDARHRPAHARARPATAGGCARTPAPGRTSTLSRRMAVMRSLDAQLARLVGARSQPRQRPALSSGASGARRHARLFIIGHVYFPAGTEGQRAGPTRCPHLDSGVLPHSAAAGAWCWQAAARPSPTANRRRIGDGCGRTIVCRRQERHRQPAPTTRAIKTLERVEGRAAGTLLAQQAQLDLAYAYWRSGERAQALATIERFIKLNPSSPALDYALYLRGVINFNDDIGVLGSLAGQDLSERDQRASRDAYQAFKQLVDQFPELGLCRGRARAHGLHRQLAGQLRVARGALLLPPRRLSGGGQPRAARGDRLPGCAGQRRGAVHHGAGLRQAGARTRCATMPTASSRRTSPTASSPRRG